MRAALLLVTTLVSACALEEPVSLGLPCGDDAVCGADARCGADGFCVPGGRAQRGATFLRDDVLVATVGAAVRLPLRTDGDVGFSLEPATLGAARMEGATLVFEAGDVAGGERLRVFGGDEREAPTASVQVFVVEPAAFAFELQSAGDVTQPGSWRDGKVPTQGGGAVLVRRAADGARLTAPQRWDSLVVETGATLLANGQSIAVTAGVVVGGTVAEGVLTASGGGIAGHVAQLSVTGPTALVGAVHADSDVAIEGNSARLDVGAAQLVCARDFSTATDGVLSMSDPAGRMLVEGDTRFRGGRQRDLLVAGTVEARGAFTQQTADGVTDETFAALGSHLTRLSGADEQAVSFDSGNSFFAGLALSADTKVRAPGGVTAIATFTLEDGAELDASGAAVAAGGVLSVRRGAALRATYLTLYAPWTFAQDATFEIETIQLFGAAGSLVPGLPYQNVLIGGAVRADGPIVATGGLTIVGDGTNNGALTLGAADVSVGGLLAVQGTGRLVMQHADATLVATGPASFGGADANGAFTAGTLVVQTSFAQLENFGISAATFVASDNHVTIFDGPAVQVSLANPQQSSFRHVRVPAGAGALIATNATISGDLTVDGTLQILDGATLTVLGTATFSANATRSGALVATTCVGPAC